MNDRRFTIRFVTKSGTLCKQRDLHNGYPEITKIRCFLKYPCKTAAVKSAVVRDPDTPGLSNLRKFSREGATVFILLSQIKANPPGGGLALQSTFHLHPSKYVSYPLDFHTRTWYNQDKKKCKSFAYSTRRELL